LLTFTITVQLNFWTESPLNINLHSKMTLYISYLLRRLLASWIIHIVCIRPNTFSEMIKQTVKH